MPTQPSSSLTPADQDKPAATGLDPNQLELFKGFLDFQKQELDLRRKEFEMQTQENTSNHELSMLSLKLQSEDNKDERIHKRVHATRTYWFIGIIVLMLLVFAGYALKTGKEAFVEKAGQLVVTVLGAVGSGYAICLHRARRDDSNKSPSNP